MEAMQSRPKPKLILASEHDEENFDEVIRQNFQAEGFDVSYLPLPKRDDDILSVLSQREDFAMVGSFSFHILSV